MGSAAICVADWQYPCSLRLRAGSSVHFPFEGLESVDPALMLAVVPRQFCDISHNIIVAVQGTAKSHDGDNARLDGAVDP